MEKMQKAVAVVDDLWWNRHGFPQGYHFVPSDLELIRLLEDFIAGRPLPYPLPTIFRNVRIREYHPAELHEMYKAHKEAGCIYFFSEREFPGNARVRPRRFAKDGWWKASGGGEPLKRGGLTVGCKLTLVFYDKKPGQKVGVKTNWAIKEYTKIVDKKAEEMALYRLYKMNKPSNGKQATQEDESAPASTWAEEEEEEEAPPPSPPHPPAGGTFSQAQAGQPHDDHNYACDATPGPSTSCSVMPDAGYMWLTGSSPATTTYPPQHIGVQYTDGLAHWDVLPAMVPSGPAAVAHGLPASGEHFGYQETEVDAKHFGYQETIDPLKTQLLPASAEHFDYQETAVDAKHFVYQETTDPLKTQLPPPPPVPAAQGGYLGDEFDVWCETQQGSQQVAVNTSSPMLGDIDSHQVAVSPFPMLEDTDFDGLLRDIDLDGLLEAIDFNVLLEDTQMMPTDENNERFSCTLEELLYPKMEDAAPPPADVDAQRSGSE